MKIDKCVILARARTGSNLLKSYLNSVEGIEIKDEIFLRVGDSNLETIFKNSFKAEQKNVQISGFKYFYDQPIDDIPNRKKVIKFIKSSKNLLIIHLKRKNYLKILVSHKLAHKSGIWMIKKDQKYKMEKELPKITLERKECWKFFKDIRINELKYDKIFAENLKTEITYEHLVKYPEGQMKRLLGYLGVETGLKFSTDLVKQNKRPLSEVIANYDKLKKSFLNTNFEHFFE